MILTVTPNVCLARIAVVEHLQLREPIRPKHLYVDAGGGGIHAARAIRELGGDALACGFLGGHIGALVRELLDGEGLCHDLTEIAGETRIAYVVLDVEQGALIEIPEPGPTVSPSEVGELERTIGAYLAGAKMLVLSGSLPPGSPPELYRELITLASGLDVPVILDSHGEALRQAVGCHPYLVKVNLSEFIALTGQPPVEQELASLAAAGRRVIESGPEWILLSLGARGALLISADRAAHLPAPQVPPYNPIGSGDTMVGAFAENWVRTGDPVESARVAVAAATANVRYDRAGIVSPGDVEHWLPAIQPQFMED